MSLYPPRTVVGIRATRRRDILEERWRHWQNIVDSRKVANAIRATKLSIDGLSAAFERDPPSTFAPYRKTRSALTHESPFEKVFRDATSADSTPARRGRAGAAPRVLDAYGNYVTVVPSEAARRKAAFAAMAARATGPSVALAWKHWRHFVHIRRHSPHLMSALAEHECAVVAWKAWKFLAFGRPVARDPEVVVAWKHWKHWALAEVATRNARADALARRLRAARDAELKRRDEKKVREVRRANAAAERRRKCDEEWGFTDADEYAVRRRERARREARRQKEAQLRRRDLFGPDGDQIEDGDGEMEEKADEDTKPMDFATFSHTVVCWRRWRRFVKGVRSGEFTNDDAADQARAEAEAQARMEEVRLAAMRRVGVDAPEIRNLADLAMRRQPGDSDDDSQRADSEDEDENASEKGPTEEEERAALEAVRSAKREAAALKIQKIAKGFIQRRRYQRMKKDPFYRVRGLKALIARGEKIFERDAERVARAKEQWFKSERRLAGMRMANEDAMSGLKVAKDRLSVLNEARGRIGVAERAKEIERKRDNWMKIWDDSQPGFSSAGFNPFPSFPRISSDMSESARKARRSGASAAFASLPSTKDEDLADAWENVDPGKVLDALLEESDEEFERRMMQVMPRWTPSHQSPIGLPLARRTPNYK